MPGVDGPERYRRQMSFGPLGAEGQRRLAASTVLIVGVGGLGCTLADLLARAGVGRLRLADDDRVSLDNLHRQVLYTEQDAAAGLAKVRAAAARLAAVNSQVAIEPLAQRLSSATAAALADGAHLLLDGSDNFATRFLLNDLAVREGKPCVLAGVRGAEGLVMPVLPGRTACLRCLLDQPPADEPSPPVLGPAVAAIAALQALEAIKILAGRLEDVQRGLAKYDFWTGRVQRLALPGPVPGCACCGQRRFEFLR